MAEGMATDSVQAVQKTDPGRSRNSDSVEQMTGDNEYDTKDASKFKGMTKAHYIGKEERKRCFNQSCQKKFSLKIRPRHCRRCGEVFCMKCLRYKRRLNNLAHPDPEGKPRKVCKLCYDEDAFSVGITRSITEEFINLRSTAREMKIRENRENSLTTTFWRDQLDLEDECHRLLDGFKQTVGNSGSKAALHEMKSKFAVPSWQKSSFWSAEKVAERCRSCQRGLGLRKQRKNCKVCGLALCKKCSKKELLVYICDDRDIQSSADPRLALIKVVGCPEKEPDISLLLHVCGDCKGELEVRQKANPDWFESGRGLVYHLVEIDKVFSNLQAKLTDQLNEFDSQLDVYETAERSGSFSTGNDSNKDRASVKSQATQPYKPSEDESDKMLHLQQGITQVISKFEDNFQRLKSFSSLPETKSQLLLLQNYTKCKYDFLMDNKFNNMKHLVNRWKCLTEETFRSSENS